jgi:hypothetical protein
MYPAGDREPEDVVVALDRRVTSDQVVAPGTVSHASKPIFLTSASRHDRRSRPPSVSVSRRPALGVARRRSAPYRRTGTRVLICKALTTCGRTR